MTGGRQMTDRRSSIDDQRTTDDRRTTDDGQTVVIRIAQRHSWIWDPGLRRRSNRNILPHLQTSYLKKTPYILETYTKILSMVISPTPTKFRMVGRAKLDGVDPPWQLGSIHFPKGLVFNNTLSLTWPVLVSFCPLHFSTLTSYLYTNTLLTCKHKQRTFLSFLPLISTECLFPSLTLRISRS